MSQMLKYVERVAKLSGLEEITPGQQMYIENLYAEGFSKNAAVRELMLKYPKSEETEGC